MYVHMSEMYVCMFKIHFRAFHGRDKVLETSD